MGEFFRGKSKDDHPKNIGGDIYIYMEYIYIYMEYIWNMFDGIYDFGGFMMVFMMSS